MKALIVDDEDLTREGLISIIDWKKYGITEIFQANDGLNGLELARKVIPDLIICDVRMPRMDGINMLDRIQKINPGVAAIFMSGFSDKEYLKAAIRLKAINYIEKPIEPKEMNEAIEAAVAQIAERAEQAAQGVLRSHQTASQLAYDFTNGIPETDEDKSIVSNKLTKKFPGKTMKSVACILVKFKTAPDGQDSLGEVLTELNEQYFGSIGAGFIYSEKRLPILVMFLFSTHNFTLNTLKIIAEEIKTELSEFGKSYISIGLPSDNLFLANNSYVDAATNLQYSFFFPAGTIFSADMFEGSSSAVSIANIDSIAKLVSDYKQSLSEGIESNARKALDSLKSILDRSVSFSQNQIKGMYFDMFRALFEERQKRHILKENGIGGNTTAMDILEGSFTFNELSLSLTFHTSEYFSDLTTASEENSTISLIKSYVAAHYSDPTLSVKDISDYAKLSAPYACTFFKNETGTTINQYITDYRMKKAKQLLRDPRNRVSEISEMVGYNDGNYFGKSFRKYTGLSPSEFRDAEQAGNK